MNGWSFKRAETSLPVGRLCEIIFCTHKRVVGREEGGEAGDAARLGGRADSEDTSSYKCRARDGGKSILCKPAEPPSALWYSAQLFQRRWGGGVSGTEHGLRSCPNRMLSSTCAPDLLFHICSVLYPPPPCPAPPAPVFRLTSGCLVSAAITLEQCAPTSLEPLEKWTNLSMTCPVCPPSAWTPRVTLLAWSILR